MKHILKKLSLQGGGSKKPKPKPAILTPPKLGQYELLNSYSVAEIVDLISDGPVEGLVNQNGQSLSASSMLQGVYLNNTPVEVTSSLDSSISTDSIYSYPIFDKLNILGNIYYQNNKYLFDYHQPVVKNGSLTTKINESRLFVTNMRYELPNTVGSPIYQEYYSPLVDGLFPLNSTYWNWLGNAKNSNARYFSDSGSNKTIEMHYLDNTMFSNGTILSSFESDLLTDLNSATINTWQKGFASEAKSLIENLKSLDQTQKFNWDGDNKCFAVVRIGTKTSPLNMSFIGNDSKSVIDSNGKLIPVTFDLQNFTDDFPNSQIYKLIVPVINDSNNYTGEFYGCLVFVLDTEAHIDSVLTKKTISGSKANYNAIYSRQIFKNIYGFTRPNTSLIFRRGNVSSAGTKEAKYNFLNVACEFRAGDEFQDPLSYFKNIYVDYEYRSELFGPFRLDEGSVRRIDGEWDDADRGAKNPKLNIPLNQVEGSDDVRSYGTKTKSFADYNNYSSLAEDADPKTHTIENPNVTSVFFTLGISALSDTQHISKDGRDAGEKLPAIAEIEVEWGKVSDGIYSEQKTRKYAIVALIEGQMLLDFGCPDLANVENDYLQSVRNVTQGDFSSLDLSQPFELPKLNSNDDASRVKRYIKVTKTSTESNSVLIQKDLILYKVTEIIDNNLSYPNSSIMGIKIDARSFGDVPERTYDCRLKRIKIPTNYFPLKSDGSDRRYIKSQEDYDKGQLNLLYDGDWNGEFKVGWTDNPAWIIYDLLTSKRYGLGQYIDESQINKWELYKIARFCDAVNDDGFFEGVADGYGGLEPRYSCNIIFSESTKIFDAINTVANLFRGVVFFSNSEIQFLDDRPRIPIAIFSNTNVKNGIFTYGNNRRDQQFNTVEVAYLDRFDNYQTKIEYIQDEADIRKRGVFKTQINTAGVVSKAMARRIGQHLIYQTIKENQSIEFNAGLESLLCRPGDLIIIEDELKTRSANYGRILDINLSDKILRIDNQFDSGSFTGLITAFTPTGFKSSSDLLEISSYNRSRLPYFDLTGILIDSSDSVLTGRYLFSGYGEGFPTGDALNMPNQFPIYTGLGDSGQSIFCYYHTGAFGFIFSTGKAFQNDNLYDKVITNTGVSDIIDIAGTNANALTDQNYKVFRHNNSSPFKRSVITGSAQNDLLVEFSSSYKGILNSEINTVNNSQITTFQFTGFANLDFGSEIYLDSNNANISLLPIISQGSPYRIQRQNASDQIYKILSIREINQNEYTIAASKYDTGKFVAIENAIASEFLPETYYSGPISVNNVVVDQLGAPFINLFTTSSTGLASFSLTGSWNQVIGSTGYQINIYNSLSNNKINNIVDSNTTGINITGLYGLGQWIFEIQSLGNGGSKLDSQFSRTGSFVSYNAITELNRAAITNIFIS